MSTESHTDGFLYHVIFRIAEENHENLTKSKWTEYKHLATLGNWFKLRKDKKWRITDKKDILIFCRGKEEDKELAGGLRAAGAPVSAGLRAPQLGGLLAVLLVTFPPPVCSR
ncbi:hypothetical protein Q8A73_013142 [Channa argus]|nr:hypothetical protein Q8A73_013142 [Channa argus]